MKTQIAFAIALMTVMVMPSVLANGCCLIQNEKCTFWDFSCTSPDCQLRQQSFCEKLDDWGYAQSSTWYDNQACAEITVPPTCENGFDIPEFGAIGATVALIGAGLGFIALRKKR
ncbi:MAG: hypothetical protein V1660_02735 [archaeon]